MTPAPRAGRWAAGVAGGLVGGVSIWLYEAVVWVRIQHLLPLGGIPANAVGLVFGGPFRERLGPAAGLFGAVIHFGFAIAWGIAFAECWPWLRRRGWEASLAGLVLTPILWTVMHAAIVWAGHDHPDYSDPTVVIGGLLSHVFYAVPMALVVKRRL